MTKVCDDVLAPTDHYYYLEVFTLFLHPRLLEDRVFNDHYTMLRVEERNVQSPFTRYCCEYLLCPEGLRLSCWIWWDAAQCCLEHEGDHCIRSPYGLAVFSL